MRNHQIDFSSLKLHTIKELIDFSTGHYPGDIAFTYSKSKKIIEMSYCQLGRSIYSLSSVLFEKQLAGKAIALIGPNCIEWIISFFAVALCGSVVVPIDKDLPADEIAYILQRVNASAVIASNEYSKKIESIDKSGNLQVITFENINNLTDTTCSEVQNIHIDPDDTAAIVFTSGTEGKSKGVELSHENLVCDALSSCKYMVPFKKMLMVLPLHHLFGLITSVFDPLIEHINVYICKNLRRISKDIRLFSPDIIPLVPAIADAIYQKTMKEIAKESKAGQFNRALLLSNALKKLGIDKRREIFQSIHSSLGGKLAHIICGGAPADENVLKWFESIGINAYNGYGISECSPIVSVNPYWNNKLSTVGPPLQCCKVKINDPDENGCGEILVSGKNVMKGYFNDEKSTADAFVDNWFRTGDIGKMDKDGYIQITGRMKNLIILKNGKNVSAEELEQKLMAFDEIEECVVKEQDGVICAVIYPAIIEDKQQAHALVSAAVKSLNKTLPSYKTIAKIELRTQPFEKTSTLKIKRR